MVRSIHCDVDVDDDNGVCFMVIRDAGCIVA